MIFKNVISLFFVCKNIYLDYSCQRDVRNIIMKRIKEAPGPFKVNFERSTDLRTWTDMGNIDINYTETEVSIIKSVCEIDPSDTETEVNILKSVCEVDLTDQRYEKVLVQIDLISHGRINVKETVLSKTSYYSAFDIMIQNFQNKNPFI